MGRAAMGSRLGSIGLLIGNRWLALWFLANGIAQIGHRVYLLAIPWLVMTMTGSAMYMCVFRSNRPVIPVQADHWF
ncbi:hypothetical protein [Symbiobacterium thermophilum]|uniref:Uncharacterized protein n=1 Tax=Symbiobacterium thermophilum TaxID=2734 RepID=A0A953I6A5_SYMTR|nr:hypothetical protein [Symbiobacterium thermophilum]MBY6277786.1 hypothetical protein [Symbiobacterium thermophilum]